MRKPEFALCALKLWYSSYDPEGLLLPIIKPQFGSFSIKRLPFLDSYPLLSIPYSWKRKESRTEKISLLPSVLPIYPFKESYYLPKDWKFITCD
jgi:hypothetical protein